MDAAIGMSGGAADSATKASLSALTRAWAAEYSVETRHDPDLAFGRDDVLMP